MRCMLGINYIYAFYYHISSWIRYICIWTILETNKLHIIHIIPPNHPPNDQVCMHIFLICSYIYNRVLNLQFFRPDFLNLSGQAFTFCLRSSKLHSLLIPLLLTSRGVSHSTGPLCLRCDTRPPSAFCRPGFDVAAPFLWPAAGQLGTKFPDQLRTWCRLKLRPLFLAFDPPTIMAASIPPLSEFDLWHVRQFRLIMVMMMNWSMLW